MITKIRLALCIIGTFFLSSMTGCSGGSGDSTSSSPSSPPGSPPLSPPGSPPAAATGVTATITGLAPNTTYYFAVSAYNGMSGPCSNEVSTVTPPSGVVSLAWDPDQDPSVTAYDVHYGKQSSSQPASCTYSDSLRVAASP